MKNKINVTLINPPHIPKDYVPQGLFVLKRQLADRKRAFGDGHVKIIDLNIKYFNHAFLVEKSKVYCGRCCLRKKCSSKSFPLEDTIKLREKIIECEEFILREYLLNDAKLPIEREVNAILTNSPGLVGFSIFNTVYAVSPYMAVSPFSTGQLTYSLALAKAIKERNRNIKIIFGGSSLYSIDQNQELMRFFSDIDFIVRGSGELALFDIVKTVAENSQRFDAIPNIIWRKDEDGGRIVQNKIVKPEKYECSVPDYSGVDLSMYSPGGDVVISGEKGKDLALQKKSPRQEKESFNEDVVLPIKLSSGCYWGKCKFCTFSKISNHRRKTKKDIRRELSYYINELKIDKFTICDESVPPEVFSDFADIIKKEKWKISYLGLARPTKHFTEELLTKIYRSGCKIIFWGAETFSQELQRKVGKGLTVKDIQSTLIRSYDAGICNLIFGIYDLPFQTKKTLEDDLQFLDRNIKYITQIAYQRFRLDRASLYFKDFNDEEILVPIFEKGPVCVNSLLCKWSSNKELVRYFNDNILPFVKNKTVSMSLNQLIRLLAKNSFLNSKNIRQIKNL
ncbi:MAG: hypothetical protein KAJ18_04145 [Candidatus Omnitrophica bacterium]|nr:hypothetical protein [Candidatus Omnitrophota bacterium]